LFLRLLLVRIRALSVSFQMLTVLKYPPAMVLCPIDLNVAPTEGAVEGALIRGVKALPVVFVYRP
jgi:hypothetical protein